MARMGSFDTSALKKLQQSLNKLQNDTEINQFCEACAKELAARLLAKVIKKTLPGQYKEESGKKGGTLKRGWTTSGNGSGSEGLNTRRATDFVDTLRVNYYGGVYVIEIVNPVSYASYVEFGHRTANHSGWVKGKFMMTISEQEIEKIAPKLLENKLKKFIGGAFCD